MTDSDAEKGPAKRPYVKPEVKQVSLSPEEAVLGACKASNRLGPGQATCSTPAPCSSIGS